MVKRGKMSNDQSSTKLAGSNWHVWDLHLHTPGTLQNDLYGNNKQTREDLLDEIVKHSISAIGITDYYGWKLAFELKRLISERKLQVTVFPNVELRDTKAPNQSRLNYHIVFSDKLKEEEISNALGRIRANTDSGKKSLNELDDSERRSATVGIEEARNSLVEGFESKYGKNNLPFIILAASGSDGYRERENGSEPSPASLSESNIIVQNCDAFFGNKADREFWLDPDKYDERPRPVFSGSDAHDLKRLTEFHSGDKKTWIKGEVTFQGLRECLVEPEDRIRIQAKQPNDKDAAKVIESFTIHSSRDDANEFSQTIKLNPGLNSIIGARSSGKSILGAALSYSINPGNTLEWQQRARILNFTSNSSQKLENVGPAAGWPWVEFVKNVDFEITWHDGTKSNSSSPKGMINYFPQGYLNAIAEDHKEISRLLEQAIENQSQRKWIQYTQDREGILSIRKKISDASIELYELSETINDLHESLKSQTSISSLQQRANDLNSKVSSLHELVDIESIKSEVTELTELERLKKSWKILPEGLTPLHLDLPRRPRVQSEIEIHLGARLDKEWTRLMNEFYSSTSCEVEQYLEGEQRAATWNQARTSALESHIRDKNGGKLPKETSAEIEQAQQQANAASTDLEKAKKLHSELENLSSTLAEKIDEFSSLRESYTTNLSSAISNFDEIPIGTEDLRVSAESGYSFHTLVDLGKANSNSQSAEWGDLKEFRSALSNGIQPHNIDAVPVLKAILDGDITFRKTNRTEENRRKAFLDIASILPDIALFGTLDRDRFGGFGATTMSAGKRALAGLSLVLSDSEHNGPLILDQPEDDLDSRSIISSIVPYLRKSKSRRQIIMISHNANLVVGADSELVIVANQHSAEYPNKDEIQFCYAFGSLESQVRLGPNSSFFARNSIKGHICDLLDGGSQAFEKRALRYS